MSKQEIRHDITEVTLDSSKCDTFDGLIRELKFARARFIHPDTTRHELYHDSVYDMMLYQYRMETDEEFATRLVQEQALIDARKARVANTAENRKVMIDKALTQIVQDLSDHDLSAIVELLNAVPSNILEGFVREE